MDSFREKVMHELRLIDEQCYRRIKIFAGKHIDDDALESQENMESRDLFKDWEEEELDDINYTKLRLAKKRFKWETLLKRETELEKKLQEMGSKVAELDGKPHAP